MTYDPQQPYGGGQSPQWPNQQQGYYAPPPAMLAYGTPTARPRPTSATVLAIIGIVLASFWILGAFGGVFQLFFTVSMMRSLIRGGMGGFETVMRVQAFESIVGGLIGIALLIATIGLLRFASWARRAMVIIAIVDLVFILSKMVITLAWAIPYQARAMTSLTTSTMTGTAPTASFSAASSTMESVQMAMALGMAIFMAAYPVMVLVFMTKARMKQVYDDQQYM